MSQFEYLAVFLSIIFGISVTHILAGAVRSIYRKRADETHIVMTAFFFLVLILNWWVGFKWHDHLNWSFGQFLIIILWAVTHYIAAITLYPPQTSGASQPLEFRRNWFLWAFAISASMDIVLTWARGELFTPPVYLPFVGHYIVLSLVAIAVNKAAFHRWMAWYFLIVMLTWSFVVRRFLE